MADKNFKVRMEMIGGKKIKAELVEIGYAGKNSLNDIEKSSNSSRFALQNTAYQVQDVFVQVAAGTSASRALAQQLPQLLSGFGLFGVLAGTASAALIPLASHLFGVGEDSETSAKKIDDLISKIGELKKANSVYSTEGIQALIEKYGELDAAVFRMIDRQHKNKETDAFEAAKKSVAGLGTEIEGVSRILRNYDGVQKLIAKNNYGDSEVQSQKALIATTTELNDKFGISVEQARALLAAFDAVRAANTVPEMASAVATLNALLDGTVLGTRDLQDQLTLAEDTLLQLKAQGDGVNSWLDAATKGAWAMAAGFWDAAKGAAAIRVAERAARTSPETAMLIDQYSAYGKGQMSARDRAIADRAIYGGNGDGLTMPEYQTLHPVVGASKGGAAGGALNDQFRDAQRLYDQTRTEAEKYAAEQKNINDLMASGALDADTYQRAMDMIAKKYGDASDAGKFFGDITGDLKDAFLDLAIEGEASFDKIAKAIERALLQALAFGDGPLGEMFGGPDKSLMGMIFPSIAGAKASGGPVLGSMPYLVGEKGPELFTPHSSGMIHKAGSFTGRGQGGGTVINVIDQRSSGQAVETSRKRGPDGREIVTTIVRDAIGRGELDGAQKSRFGARPVGVKR